MSVKDQASKEDMTMRYILGLCVVLAVEFGLDNGGVSIAGEPPIRRPRRP